MFFKSTNAGSFVDDLRGLITVKPGKPINYLLRYDGIDVLNTNPSRSISLAQAAEQPARPPPRRLLWLPGTRRTYLPTYLSSRST